MTARVGSAHAVFTARQGGVSEAPYDSLNLGIFSSDDPGRINRNLQLAMAAVQRSERSATMTRQVHGTQVVQVSLSGPSSSSQERPVGDAQVTSDPKVTPLVLVADCYPVVVAGPGGVAVAHCGWRGVAAGIVGEVVRAVSRLTSRASNHFFAAIGPGIGPCCYEVGDDVREAFNMGPGQKREFDLAEQIAQRLVLAGLDSSRVGTCGVCVSCASDLFFSHRRDGPATGRQAGFAWLAS